MKKILSLLLVFTLTLTLFAGLTVHADDFTDTIGTKYQIAADVLETLGIAKGYLDGTYDITGKMTKAEFCYILASITNMADSVDGDTVYWADVKKDHWAYRYINYATVMGLTEGSGIYYYPDMKITGNEICKAIVKILNYDFKVSNDNYSSVASSLGITKGVTFNANSAMTRGDILLLVYQALRVKMPIKGGVSNLFGTEYKVGNDTLLSYYHDVFTGEGQVTAVGNVDLYNASENAKENDVRINDVLFKAADTFNRGLFGYNVDYFYLYNADNEIPQLLCAYPKSDNEIIEVKASMVAGVTDDYVLKYFANEDSLKTSRHEISSGAKFLYNGRIIPESKKNAKLLSFNSGKLKIITPGSGIEVVVIDTYDYYIVDSVGNNKIYLINDEYNAAGEKVKEDKLEILLDPDSDDYEFDIYSAGKTTVLEDIIAKTAVGVSRSWNLNGKPYIRIKLITSSVSGIITAYNTDTLTVNNVTYNRDSNINNLNLKKSFTLYLDEDDTVVLAYASASSDLNFGYIVEAAIDGGMAKRIDLKILKASGEFQVFSLDRDYTLDDDIIKANQNPLNNASGEKLLQLYNGKYYAKTQLIAYKLSDDGKISEIYTVSDFTGRNEITGENIQDKDAPLYKSSEIQRLQYKGGSTSTFASQYYLKETGVFFRVTNAAHPDILDPEKDFVVLTSTSFTNDANYNIQCFNANEGNACGVILIWVNKSDNAGDVAVDYDKEQNLKICEYVTRASVNGELTYKVYYYDAGVLTSKALAVGSGNNYDETLETVKKLKKGDVFMFTETGGDIKYLQLDFSVSNPSESGIQWNDKRFYLYGQVAARVSTDEVMLYRGVLNDNDEWVLDKSRAYVYRGMARNSIYLYSGKDNPIQTLENIDIKVGDWILVRARYAVSKEFVVIRDNDK